MCAGPRPVNAQAGKSSSGRPLRRLKRHEVTARTKAPDFSYLE